MYIEKKKLLVLFSKLANKSPQIVQGSSFGMIYMTTKYP